MSIIVASILDADWLNLRSEIERVDAAGVDAFSVDVMDGHFAPRITFGAQYLAQIRNWTDLPIEAHLMIANPEGSLEIFCDAGADQVVFHTEATDAPMRLIEYVRERELCVGVAIQVDTPVSALSDDVLRHVDVVNLLAVPIGFGGAATAGDTEVRIAELRRRGEDLGNAFAIEVDGGVKPSNCAQYAVAGADLLTIGTGIYKSGNYDEAVTEARNALSPFRDASRPRVADFVSVPSSRHVADEKRRQRLDLLRQSLDIPTRNWDPLTSAR